MLSSIGAYPIHKLCNHFNMVNKVSVDLRTLLLTSLRNLTSLLWTLYIYTVFVVPINIAINATLHLRKGYTSTINAILPLRKDSYLNLYRLN